MSIIVYLYEEMSMGLDFLDSWGPISLTEKTSFHTTTFLFAGLTFLTTFFGCLYDDWSPYRGYMKGFLHKNWMPDYQPFRVGEHVYPNGWMNALDQSHVLVSDRVFTRFHMDLDWFYRQGIIYWIKDQPRFFDYDRHFCHDQPWWWDLLHSYLLPFYKRYEWVAFRKIYVEWYYNFPFITHQLNYSLHETDRRNPLPTPPWPPESFLWYRIHTLEYDHDMWKPTTLLYNRAYNQRSFIPSPCKEKSISSYM